MPMQSVRLRRCMREVPAAIFVENSCAYKKTWQRVFLLALLLLFPSCAKMKAYGDIYSAPPFADTAKLYLDLPRAVNVGLFSNEDCMLGKYGTRVVLDEVGAVSEVDGYEPRFSPYKNMKPVYLEPGLPQVVSLHLQTKMDASYRGALRECHVSFKFTPIAKHNYVAIYDHSDKYCKAIILDLTAPKKDHKYVVPADLKQLAESCDLFEYQPEYQAAQN